MTKDDRDQWQKRKDAEESGIDLTPWDGLNVEHQNTAKHEFVKFALTRVLYDLEREWDSEVQFPNGREADIVDLGPTDGKMVVYEVETDLTDSRKRQKLNHFEHETIRDVICIDPADVPNELDEAIDYLETYEVI